MSDRADRYASAAAGSTLIGAGGAAAWAKGRSTRRSSLERGAANRNYAVIHRAGLDAAQEAVGSQEQAQVAANRARRREALVTSTKARLTEVGPNRYVQPGRRGFYPSRRLSAMQNAAAADRASMKQSFDRGVTLRADSRSRLTQAARMERDFGVALKDFARSKKVVRGGKVGVAAGTAGALGFGVAAERAKTRRAAAKPVELKHVRPNVIDMDRYRNARSSADDRGSLLVDAQGHRKQLAANAGSAWLKNHGRQS